MDTLVLGVFWYVAFLFSSTLHEAAHAWMSQRGGDWTAYHGGQVSLDPLPHIRREPIGMVVVPIVTFFAGGWMMGWASAPYDPRWADAYPRRAAWMSLAGPAANFLLVVLMFLAIRAGVAAGIFLPPHMVGPAHIVEPVQGGVIAALARLVSIMFMLNLVLTVFNLLPVPPLDGSGALPLLMSEGAARRYHAVIMNPTFMMVGIFIAWNVFNPLFQPVMVLALRLLYPGVMYG
jgi:Zn-dependent protease